MHLLAGGLAGAGPLLAALLRLFRKIRTDADEPLRALAAASIAAMFVGVVIGGLAAAALCWNAESAYRLAAWRLPGTAYGMLAAEWVFSLVLLAVYVATWNRLSNRPMLHGLIAIVAATNLLYHFPTMMIVIGRLAAEPGFAAEPVITRPVFRRLITSPDLLAKTAHFWSLSFLVSGISAAWIANHHAKAPNHLMARAGGLAALLGLALSLFTGVVTLTQIDTACQRALIGGDIVTTAPFSLALLAALWLAYTLLPIATGDAPAGGVRRAGWLTIAATLLMAFASHRAVSSVF